MKLKFSVRIRTLFKRLTSIYKFRQKLEITHKCILFDIIKIIKRNDIIKQN